MQGFHYHFSGFLHHFVLAKLATSSIEVRRDPYCVCMFVCEFVEQCSSIVSADP